MMRFWLTLVVGFIGVSLIGAAQQTTTLPRVKSPNEFKVKTASGDDVIRSSAPPLRVTGSSAKDLENIERQTPTGSASHSSKRTSAAGLPSEHDRPTPKINFKANGTPKNSGLVRPGGNPLAGRMRQKGQ